MFFTRYNNSKAGFSVSNSKSVLCSCGSTPRRGRKRQPMELVYFRAKTAVILRGLAVVELAFPFQVERLPSDPGNYWRDLHVPCAQFEFPFPAEAGSGEGSSLSNSSPGGPQANAASPALVVDEFSPERHLPPINSRAPSEVDRSSREDAVKGDRCQPPPGPIAIPICSLNCSPSTH